MVGLQMPVCIGMFPDIVCVGMFLVLYVLVCFYTDVLNVLACFQMAVCVGVFRAG